MATLEQRLDREIAVEMRKLRQIEPWDIDTELNENYYKYKNEMDRLSSMLPVTAITEIVLLIQGILNIVNLYHIIKQRIRKKDFKKLSRADRNDLRLIHIYENSHKIERLKGKFDALMDNYIGAIETRFSQKASELEQAVKKKDYEKISELRQELGGISGEYNILMQAAIKTEEGSDKKEKKCDNTHNAKENASLRHYAEFAEKLEHIDGLFEQKWSEYLSKKFETTHEITKFLGILEEGLFGSYKRECEAAQKKAGKKGFFSSKKLADIYNVSDKVLKESEFEHHLKNHISEFKRIKKAQDNIDEDIQLLEQKREEIGSINDYTKDNLHAVISAERSIDTQKYKGLENFINLRGKIKKYSENSAILQQSIDQKISAARDKLKEETAKLERFSDTISVYETLEKIPLLKKAIRSAHELAEKLDILGIKEESRRAYGLAGLFDKRAGYIQQREADEKKIREKELELKIAQEEAKKPKYYVIPSKKSKRRKKDEIRPTPNYLEKVKSENPIQSCKESNHYSFEPLKDFEPGTRKYSEIKKVLLGMPTSAIPVKESWDKRLEFVAQKANEYPLLGSNEDFVYFTAIANAMMGSEEHGILREYQKMGKQEQGLVDSAINSVLHLLDRSEQVRSK